MSKAEAMIFAAVFAQRYADGAGLEAIVFAAHNAVLEFRRAQKHYPVPAIGPIDETPLAHPVALTLYAFIKAAES